MSDEQFRKPLSVDEQDDLFRQMEKWLKSHGGKLAEKKMLDGEMENMFRMMATILDARASHPADGDELIEEGWWMSEFGSLRRDLRNLHWASFGIGFDPLLGQVSLYLHEKAPHGGSVRCWLLSHIKTRQAVRSLLAALGVPT